MTRLLPPLALLLVLGACARDGVAPVTNRACTPADPVAAGDIPYPLNGFDYQTALATNRGGGAKPLRAHGWDLFEAINQPSTTNPGVPVWRTWGTAYGAFRPYPATVAIDSAQIGAARNTSLRQKNRDNARLPAGPAVPSAGATVDPPVNLSPVPLYQVPDVVCQTYGFQRGTGVGECPGPATITGTFSVPQGTLFQNNGDIMLVTVPYNPTAYRWIRNRQLYSATSLDSMQAAGATRIDEFPNGSTVLKHMYWPIAADGYTALPMWTNPPGYAPDVYLGYETWRTAVAVRGSNAPPPPASGTIDVTYLDGVDSWFPTNRPPGAPLHPDFSAAPIHELNEFVHQTLSQPNLDSLCLNDRAILDQSAVWAYGRPFRAGDAIAVIATHIMVKEMPNEVAQSGWTFQTFWWADANPRSTGPNQQNFGAGRPDSVLPGYYMMVDDGLPSPNRPGYWAAHYNPFIEPVIHPVQSSCQNCHARAGWPSQRQYEKLHGVDTTLAGTLYGAYQLDDISLDPGLLRAIYPGDSINARLMTADYLWSIIDRAH